MCSRAFVPVPRGVASKVARVPDSAARSVLITRGGGAWPEGAKPFRPAIVLESPGIGPTLQPHPPAEAAAEPPPTALRLDLSTEEHEQQGSDQGKGCEFVDLLSVVSVVVAACSFSSSLS